MKTSWRRRIRRRRRQQRGLDRKGDIVILLPRLIPSICAILTFCYSKRKSENKFKYISHVCARWFFVAVVVVVWSSCICSPTGHINIFEYHVFNTRKWSTHKKRENITSTRAHHRKKTNPNFLLFFPFFFIICKGGKASAQAIVQKRAYNPTKKMKKKKKLFIIRNNCADHGCFEFHSWRAIQDTWMRAEAIKKLRWFFILSHIVHLLLLSNIILA